MPSKKPAWPSDRSACRIGAGRHAQFSHRFLYAFYPYQPLNARRISTPARIANTGAGPATVDARWPLMKADCRVNIEPPTCVPAHFALERRAFIADIGNSM